MLRRLVLAPLRRDRQRGRDQDRAVQPLPHARRGARRGRGGRGGAGHAAHRQRRPHRARPPDARSAAAAATTWSPSASRAACSATGASGRGARSSWSAASRPRAREGALDPALLALDAAVTDCNGAFFDVANDFQGCIAGCHEVLRRQGLLEGTWCLDPDEGLSPGPGGRDRPRPGRLPRAQRRRLRRRQPRSLAGVTSRSRRDASARRHDSRGKAPMSEPSPARPSRGRHGQGGLRHRRSLLVALGIAIVVESLRMPRFEELNVEPYTAPGSVPGRSGAVDPVLGAAAAPARDAAPAAGAHGGATDGRRHGLRPRRPPPAARGRLCLVYAAGLVGRLPFWLATFVFVTAFVVLFEWPLPATCGPLRARRLIVRGAVRARLISLGITLRLPGDLSGPAACGAMEAALLPQLGQALLGFMTPVTLFHVAWATLLGICVGALPGLTATLGVALLTTLTFKMAADDRDPDPDLHVRRRDLRRLALARSCSTFRARPPTPRPRSTASRSARRGEAGRAMGDRHHRAPSSARMIGMLASSPRSPRCSPSSRSQFGAFEFFWLAVFGVVISGQLTALEAIRSRAGSRASSACSSRWSARKGIHSYPRFSLRLDRSGRRHRPACRRWSARSASPRC